MSLESCLSWNRLFFALGNRRCIMWRDIYSRAQTWQDSALRESFQQPSASDRLCCYRRLFAGSTIEQTITCDVKTWIRICGAGSFSPDRYRVIANANQISTVEK